MAEQVVQNTPQTEQQPKKKKKSALSKFLISLLVIFVIIPCTLIGLTYALFYDASHKNIHVREYYPIQEVVNDVATYSLNDTIISEKMRLRITEDVLNQIFYDAVTSSGDASDTLKNLYIDIGTNQYVFVMELDFAGWFRTRVLFYTQLKVTSEVVTFQINNVKLGRVGRLNNITKIFKNSKMVANINKILANNGIHMKIDLANLRFTYRVEDIANDLASKIGSSSSTYIALIKEMLLNPYFVELLPYCEKAIEGDLLLYNMRPTESLFNIEGYEMPDGYLNSIIPGAIAKTRLYLESNIIPPSHAQDILNYYVQGYDHLTTQQKATVDLYTGSILPATGTYDYTIPDEEHLDSIVIAQLESYLPGDSHVEASITTNQVDRALSEADTIGETTLFKAKSETNEYTCNYITFDRFNNVVDHVHQSLFFTVSASFNGYDVGVTLKTTLVDTSTFGKAKFHVDGFYLGDQLLSQQAFTQLLNMMSAAISSESFGDTISLQTAGDDTYLIFDISDMLNDGGFSEADGYVTTFELLPQTATTPGTLKFAIDK